MKITSQKLKVTPLIIYENYKNNESKMVFPQKQGGGVRPLWKIPQKKCFFLNLPLCTGQMKSVHHKIFNMYSHLSSILITIICEGMNVQACPNNIAY